jgi:hypothetical protein
MHSDISFAPEVLAIAPRPIAGELISSWLLRVSFANCLTLAELVQGIEARFPEVPLRGAFIDEQLSPSARSALAKFLRITEHQIKALEPRQLFPTLPMEWILRSIDWELGSPHRFVQGRAIGIPLAFAYPLPTHSNFFRSTMSGGTGWQCEQEARQQSCCLQERNQQWRRSEPIHRPRRSGIVGGSTRFRRLRCLASVGIGTY